MPKQNVVKAARAQYACGVLVPTRYGEGAALCSLPQARHTERTKESRRVTSHEYADPYLKMPVCGACNKEINIGEGYRWWHPKNRAVVVRHMTCPTPPRSFFTSSEIKAACWDICDATYGPWEDAEAFDAEVEDIKSQIQDVIDLIQEKVDNIVSGFGHEVPVSEELTDRGYELQSWLDQFEGIYGDDFLKDPEEGDEEGDEDEEPEQEFDSDEAEEALQSVLGECPE